MLQIRTKNLSSCELFGFEFFENRVSFICHTLTRKSTKHVREALLETIVRSIAANNAKMFKKF